MASKVRKHSYVIPCSSDFREAVQALADQREVNVGDVARSVMLIISEEIIAACPDPGEPGPTDPRDGGPQVRTEQGQALAAQAASPGETAERQ